MIFGKRSCVAGVLIRATKNQIPSRILGTQQNPDVSQASNPSAIFEPLCGLGLSLAADVGAQLRVSARHCDQLLHGRFIAI